MFAKRHDYYLKEDPTVVVADDELNYSPGVEAADYFSNGLTPNPSSTNGKTEESRAFGDMSPTWTEPDESPQLSIIRDGGLEVSQRSQKSHKRQESLSSNLITHPTMDSDKSEVSIPSNASLGESSASPNDDSERSPASANYIRVEGDSSNANSKAKEEDDPLSRSEEDRREIAQVMDAFRAYDVQWMDNKLAELKNQGKRGDEVNIQKPTNVSADKFIFEEPEYWWEDEFADVPVRVLPHRRVSALRHSGRGEVSPPFSKFLTSTPAQKDGSPDLSSLLRAASFSPYKNKGLQPANKDFYKLAYDCDD